MELAAEVLGTTPAYIDSVASFYTMLYRQPVGKYVLQVCRTLPCALMGAEEVVACLQEKLGITPGETTKDQLFMASQVPELACRGGLTAITTAVDVCTSSSTHPLG